MSYTKRDRIMSIAAGEAADRPPVSAWHHFLDAEADPEAFINASVAFQTKFDWDMVKIHPRAIYFAEAMGNRANWYWKPRCALSGEQFRQTFTGKEPLWVLEPEA